MTGLTLDSCNRDDPQKTREDVVFFSDEFGIPGTWETGRDPDSNYFDFGGRFISNWACPT